MSIVLFFFFFKDVLMIYFHSRNLEFMWFNRHLFSVTTTFTEFKPEL